MPDGWVIQVPVGDEWITVTYFGQDDNILPCVYDTYEQAKEASKVYNVCQIIEYFPEKITFLG